MGTTDFHIEGKKILWKSMGSTFCIFNVIIPFCFLSLFLASILKAYPLEAEQCVSTDAIKEVREMQL